MIGFWVSHFLVYNLIPIYLEKLQIHGGLRMVSQTFEGKIQAMISFSASK